MWFSLLFVDFYFTPYITTKHNNNNGMRHKTAWLDRKIDCTCHHNGSDGKNNNSSSYDWKVQHQSHFSPPFCFASLLLIHILFYRYSEGYRTGDIVDTRGIKQHGTVAATSAATTAAATTTTTNAFEQHHSYWITARVTETERFERSKEYYYQPRVIAIYANIVALTRYWESGEVWPVKIKLTLLEFFC